MSTQAEKQQAAEALASIAYLKDIMRQSMRHTAGGGTHMYAKVFRSFPNPNDRETYDDVSIVDALARFDAVIATLPVLEAIVAEAPVE